MELVTAVGQFPSHKYPASSLVDKIGVCDIAFLSREAALTVGSSRGRSSVVVDGGFDCYTIAAAFSLFFYGHLVALE